jgi:hypothetical protein
MEYEMTAEDRAKYERLERAVADLTAISAEFKALSEGHETIQNLLGPAFLASGEWGRGSGPRVPGW